MSHVHTGTLGYPQKGCPTKEQRHRIVHTALIAINNQPAAKTAIWKKYQTKWRPAFNSNVNLPADIVTDDSYSQDEVLRVMRKLTNKISTL